MQAQAGSPWGPEIHAYTKPWCSSKPQYSNVWNYIVVDNPLLKTINLNHQPNPNPSRKLLSSPGQMTLMEEIATPSTVSFGLQPVFEARQFSRRTLRNVLLHPEN